MAAIKSDTRLVMTILFVGSISGANVYFYAQFGTLFPFTAFAHALLFGLITVGTIMVMKSVFDLTINDRMEMYLLDRQVRFYWERKGKEGEQRQKVLESIKSYVPNPTQRANYTQNWTPPENQEASGFLAEIEQ
tara:strand:- start:52689 stop:53090 length:402 start_codon:yes stop_codon:yes gene_type:complete